MEYVLDYETDLVEGLEDNFGLTWLNRTVNCKTLHCGWFSPGDFGFLHLTRPSVGLQPLFGIDGSMGLLR